MRITETHGNSRNGIKGSRLSIYTESGELIDRFTVPAWYGLAYCQKHPTGTYGQRLSAAVTAAEGAA